MEKEQMIHGARIYDPSIGRFLSVDPLWEMFVNQSPYSYALNNPLSFKDPSGLAPEKEKGNKNQIQNLNYFELLKESWREYNVEYKKIFSTEMMWKAKGIGLFWEDQYNDLVQMINDVDFGIDYSALLTKEARQGRLGTGAAGGGNGTERSYYFLSKNLIYFATKEEANRLAQGLSKVLNASYSIDENNNINIDYCDLDYDKPESFLTLELRNRFENMKNEKKPLYLSFGEESNEWSGQVTINSGFLENDCVGDIFYFNYNDKIPASFESILVHDFFGHGGEDLLNNSTFFIRGVDQEAVIWENYWHIINNEPIRTRFGFQDEREIKIPSWQRNWKKP